MSYLIPGRAGMQAAATKTLHQTREENAKLKEAVALAYGYLWHVNNEPMAPIPLYSPETAAHEARKVLRDLMTNEQRGDSASGTVGLRGVHSQTKGFSMSRADLLDDYGLVEMHDWLSAPGGYPQ